MSEKSRTGLKKGYVQLYTGNAKGKTTAALGLAFRAMGCGMRTYVGQFMKGLHYGELDAAKMVEPYIVIEQFGKDTFIHVQDPPEAEDVSMAQDGLRKARDAMLSCEFDIVIFDEIITSHHFHLITLEDMFSLISSKPENVEIIFTGRYAPEELIARADLVTEMREIKHYFQDGVQARTGIER